MGENINIPKKEVPVKLFLANAQKAENYCLFLNFVSKTAMGEETLDEFLNDEEMYVAAREMSSGVMTLLNLNRVVYVITDIPGEASFNEKPIALEMDAQRLTVQHSAVLPQFAARPRDYFNSGKLFLVFIHDGVEIHINKRFVNRIIFN